MLQNQEFRASILVIAKTALSLGIAFALNALEVDGARKIRSEKKPFGPTLKDSNSAFLLYFNIIKYPFTSSAGISPIDYTKLVGVEKIPTEVGKKDVFRNSILTELAVFHNRNLAIVLDKCDFKSNPELTKYILSYQEANGLNFLNIATRNRVALGDQLTAKIINIYSDNLDKDTLLKSLDKFVLTLPSDQFKKIVDKVGGLEVLNKFYKEKFTKSEIKEVISVFHSPNIFPRFQNKGSHDLDYDGYDRSTVVEKIKDPERAYDLIQGGNPFQVNGKLMQDLISNQLMTDDEIKKHPAIFLSINNSFSGLLAGPKVNGDVESILHEQFDTSQTSLQNFVNNLQENKKFLKESYLQKTDEVSPSLDVKSPQFKQPPKEL